MMNTPIKYRKLEANPRIRAMLAQADPEDEVRVIFETTIVEGHLDEYEGVQDLNITVMMTDTMVLSGKTTVKVLERFEADEDILTYQVSF